MSTSPDVRSYLNPYPPRFGEEAQSRALTGTVYKEDKSGKIIDSLIRSVRQGSIVEVTHGFLLAPILGTTHRRRKALLERIDLIKGRGGLLREASTGRQSNNSSQCNAMLLEASQMIGASGQGRKSAENGRQSKGRPAQPWTPQQLDAMQRIWFSRRYRTRNEALAAIHSLGIRVTRTWLYAKFGSPERPGAEPVDVEPVKPRRKRAAYVYFLRVGASVKIGHSCAPHKRAADLAVANHQTGEMLAILPGGVKRERSLHKRFKKHHIRGEWFHLTEDIQKYIKRVRKVKRKK